MSIRTLIWVAGIALFATGHAAPNASTPHVTVQILAEQAVVAPGQKFTVAFHQEIIEHWHTYWENPGDSGEPVQLTWRLPDGVTAGEIQWPVPDAIPVGPLMNYGYSEAASFLTDFTLTPDWRSGEPIPIEVDAYWLVCEEACIPESALLDLQIPTGPAQADDPSHAALFSNARAAHPERLTTPIEYAVGDRAFLLAADRDPLGLTGDDTITSARFFPASWGVIDHAATQAVAAVDNIITIRASLGDQPPADTIRGILRLQTDGPQGLRDHAWAVDAAPGGIPGSASPTGPMAGTLLLALAGALLGGLILNLMPCVFPVLALKAFGLVEQASASPRQRLGGGLAYTAGVIGSFSLLGALLLAVRAGGTAVGWGFQLQHAPVVMVLALIMFGIGLSLSGVVTLGHGLTRIDHAAAGRSDWLGSFMTGVLAAVVAAPCTAPFMAAATGIALVRPPVEALAIFATLGLGLAAPYLLLTALPNAARLLPRPGAWMETLRKVLAFPMYGAAIWLVWVLAQQGGPDAVLLALIGCLVLAMAAWLWDSAQTRGLMARSAAVILAAAALGLAALVPEGTAADRRTADENVVAYDATALGELVQEGQTVFLNLTAAWCITCKVNEQVALETDAFRELISRSDVTYMRGDWTSRDPEITRVLESFDRAGVPLYVVFRPDGSTAVLPQVLTPGIIAAAIDG